MLYIVNTEVLAIDLNNTIQKNKVSELHVCYLCVKHIKKEVIL